MIPTMLLFGLVLGRWWKTCLVVGTLGWPLLLWFDNIIDSPTEFLGAAGLAALNTAVGVAIHQRRSTTRAARPADPRIRHCGTDADHRRRQRQTESSQRFRSPRCVLAWRRLDNKEGSSR